jgi:hypothetical protein
MFGSKTTADVAREAREMASEVQHDHRSHVAVCLENQRRIEARFSDVVRKLESQDTALAMFKDEQNRRLDAIKESDSKRYVAMMTLIMTTIVGIGVQIVFHFWK